MRCGQPIENSPRYFTVNSSNSRPMRDGCFPTIWNGSNVRHISSANPVPGDTTEIVMANGASFEVKLPYKDVASRIKELGRG